MLTGLIGEARRLLLWLLIGILFGWLLGSVWKGFIFGLLAFILYYFWRLAQLARWLEGDGRGNLLDSGGLWGQVFQQLSAKRRAQRLRLRRLRRDAQLIQRVVQAFPDGIVTLGAGNIIETCNRTAIRLLGLAPEYDVGQPLLNIVRNPELVDFLQTPLNSVSVESLANETASNEPLIATSKSITDIPKGVAVLEIDQPRGLSGRLMFRRIDFGRDGRLLIVQDISQRSKLLQMRRDFIANASHELKTPLTVINGDLENLEHELKDVALSEAGREALQRLHEHAWRMTHLIDDLLNLSRLESEHSVQPKETVNIAELIQKVVTEYKGAKVQLDVKADSSLGIIGSASEFYSVVLNLIQNAILHGKEDVRIKVHWGLKDNGAGHFMVRDNGPGIPAIDLPRVTERFYRVDNRHPRQLGTGLGLSIVKHVMQRFQGKLDIRNLPEGGVVVRCIFPKERIVHLVEE